MKDLITTTLDNAEMELRRIIAELQKENRRLSAKIRRQQRLLARYSSQNKPITTHQKDKGTNTLVFEKRAVSGQPK